MKMASGKTPTVGERLPLSALLSHALVAFTVEFDNESERRLRHRTTLLGVRDGAGSGADGEPEPGGLPAPWLASMAMWFNCLRFVGPEGVALGEMERLARTPTNLHGMQRWGYIVVRPDGSDARAKPPKSEWIVRARAGGRMARKIWEPMVGLIEGRWRERFGDGEIGELRDSLWGIAGRLDAGLPDCLPILGYGLSCSKPKKSAGNKAGAVAETAPVREQPLPVLLSKVLLAFAIEFESAAEVSLAISANVLRLVGEDGVRVRDLPRLSGVAKAGIAVALSYLQRHGYATIGPESGLESPGSRFKMVLLTAKGRRARDAYFRRIADIEREWRERFGADAVDRLRLALEWLVFGSEVREDDGGKSRLLAGLKPHPENWRASLPQPETFPHFPMVSHRGGYPDGS